MAETSYFFDGTTTGDSSLAPYDASEFTSIFAAYGNAVIPEYLNELEVTSATPTLGAINVNTGAALVFGTLYENTASVAVAITAAVNNRIDRIVLRNSAAGETTRITKIIGAEAANPSPPALTAVDFPLAWVWIPAGYNPATTAIVASDVHDERLFGKIGLQDYWYNDENIMYNSEFFGYSGAAAGTLPPDGWLLTGVPSTAIGNAALTNFPNQVRGQTVRIRSNAGAGMQINIHDIEGFSTYSLWSPANRVITIKGMVRLTTGAVRIAVTTTGFGGTAVTQDFYRTGVTQEYLIRVKVGNSAGNNININITSLAANSDIYIGQIIACLGYIPGNFRPKHELVWFDNDVLDASWNATAKSTAVTTINAAASFGAVIPPYFRGLIARIRGNDSGSAGATAKMVVYHTDGSATLPAGEVNCDSVTNDVIRESIAFIPNKQNDANAPFKASVTATGALTFDATIQPIGIIT